MIAEVQKYVPGYRLKNGPTFEGHKVSIFLEVEGLGDFLPKYAGNLDIMTAAAARTAEMFAQEILAGKITLTPKIGRASCRESVCQYVSISVVAVSLKTKRKTTRDTLYE